MTIPPLAALYFRTRYPILLAVFIAAYPLGARAQADPLSTFSQSLEKVVRKVAPSVVKIDVTTTVAKNDVDEDSAKPTRSYTTREHTIGSGVILDSNGYIITNAHVVRGAAALTVTLDKNTGPYHTGRGQTILPARVIGQFADADLALIKVDANGLPALPLGKETNLHQGQIIIAIGCPQGLQNTVSMGIVSSVARQITPDGHMSYIQMDAAVNPGSSGGPLVDVKGNLVGINAFFLTEGGGNEGLGFAIPARFVQFAYENLLQKGKVDWGDVGLKVQGITPSLAEGLHLPQQWGVLISDVVPGTPTEREGVHARDVIVAVDGKTVENMPDYYEAMYRKNIGDKVRLSLMRDSWSLDLEVPVTAPMDDQNNAPSAPSPTINLVAKLGVLCSELGLRSRIELASLRSHTGVLVEAKAIADDPETTLSPGDVIRSVNLISVSSVADLQTLLDTVKPGSAIVLQVERRSQFIYVAMDAD